MQNIVSIQSAVPAYVVHTNPGIIANMYDVWMRFMVAKFHDGQAVHAGMYCQASQYSKHLALLTRSS